MKILSPTVTRAVARNVLVMKRNSPHIFFAGGVIGIVSSTVLACRATLKLEKSVDEIRQDFESVKEMKASSETSGTNYVEREYFRDLGYVYVKSAKTIGKLYGPSIVIGVASVSMLTGSHVQLTRRNAALTATITAVTKAFDDYRTRVQEELGEKRELEIYRAINDEEIEEDGKRKVVKVTNPDGWSPYARFFDDHNPNWQKNSELNRIFVEAQQTYANHRLQAYGHVFLNEVYDWLGLDRSHPGAVVGWLRNPETGDGFVDFGIHEAYNSRFVKGWERSLILDFNVDGPINEKF